MSRSRFKNRQWRKSLLELSEEIEGIPFPDKNRGLTRSTAEIKVLSEVSLRLRDRSLRLKRIKDDLDTAQRLLQGWTVSLRALGNQIRLSDVLLFDAEHYSGNNVFYRLLAWSTADLDIKTEYTEMRNRIKYEIKQRRRNELFLPRHLIATIDWLKELSENEMGLWDDGSITFTINKWSSVYETLVSAAKAEEQTVRSILDGSVLGAFRNSYQGNLKSTYLPWAVVQLRELVARIYQEDEIPRFRVQAAHDVQTLFSSLGVSVVITDVVGRSSGISKSKLTLPEDLLELFNHIRRFLLPSQ